MDIDFRITEQDIREYLKNLKTKEPDMYWNYYEYKEAMFAKYMKEQKSITREGLEILMSKYNFDDNPIAGVYNYENNGKLIQTPLPTFNDYLSDIRDLDISGICHILIPAIRYYDWDRPGVLIGRIYSDLSIVAEKLNVHLDKPRDVLESTLDDYEICGKLEIKKEIINFKMGREHSRRELVAYENYYEEEKVKKIRKIVREGVNKYVQGTK